MRPNSADRVKVSKDTTSPELSILDVTRKLHDLGTFKILHMCFEEGKM